MPESEIGLAAAKSLQSCPTHATPQMAAHQAPPSLGFSRQEHWSGFPFPSPTHESEVKPLCGVRLGATSWTAAHQAPPSKGFSRQEYWSGLPLPSPSHVAEGIKPSPLKSLGSLLATDSPWTHWCNKLCFTVLSVLRGVFCDSGFHRQRTKTPGWPNVTIWSTTTVLSFFCPPGFSTEWTSQGKKTLKARTFLSPKSVA